jgi:hypothetical protein
VKGEGRAHRVTTVVAEKEISALVPGVSELRIYQADGLGARYSVLYHRFCYWRQQA